MNERIDRMARRYMSVREASAYSSISQETIRKQIKRGLLKAYKPVPRKVLIPIDDLDRMIQGATGPCYG